jgi:hypothetical protein
MEPQALFRHASSNDAQHRKSKEQRVAPGEQMSEKRCAPSLTF